MAANDFQPIYLLSRGGHPESQHFGSMAIVDVSGKCIASLGNPERNIFPRSSAKPFQAMPLLEAGGIQHFGLNDIDLALICASHSGTDQHVEAIRVLEAKMGVSEKDLLCGPQVPYHSKTARRMLINDEPASTLRHNCSGKHSGMLALAILKGWSTEDYVNPNHPVQLAIQKSISSWTGIPVEALALGIDGCSAPNFAVPLQATALAFARLMDPSEMSNKQRQAAGHIRGAMTKRPDMVAGPERFDSAIMTATQGRILSKAGAEGFQAFGLPEGRLGKHLPAMGIAIKISDGDARGKAVSAAGIELLRQLGALDQKELRELKAFGPYHEVQNQAGIVVGEGQAEFSLEKH